MDTAGIEKYKKSKADGRIWWEQKKVKSRCLCLDCKNKKDTCMTFGLLMCFTREAGFCITSSTAFITSNTIKYYFSLLINLITSHSQKSNSTREPIKQLGNHATSFSTKKLKANRPAPSSYRDTRSKKRKRQTSGSFIAAWSSGSFRAPPSMSPRKSDPISSSIFGGIDCD